MSEVGLQVLLCTVQESLRLEVRRTEGEEVDGGETGLLAGGDEDDDGRLGRVLVDGLVHWFHHGYQSRWSVRDVEPLQHTWQFFTRLQFFTTICITHAHHFSSNFKYYGYVYTQYRCSNFGIWVCNTACFNCGQDTYVQMCPVVSVWR